MIFSLYNRFDICLPTIYYSYLPDLWPCPRLHGLSVKLCIFLKFLLKEFFDVFGAQITLILVGSLSYGSG